MSESAPTLLIVGAGIAGLAAAHHARSLGVDVTVLEARSRIGGRVWTDGALGVPVDMGASWIHGVSGNPIKRVAEECGIATLPTDYDHMMVFDAREGWLSEDRVEAISGWLKGLLAEVRSVAGSLRRDTSIGAVARQIAARESPAGSERRADDYALTSLVVTAAAELEELSALHGDDDAAFGGGDELFPGGYGQIARRLALGVPVELGHAVKRIDYAAGGVRISTSRGAFEADRAIVTLPLGVLKSGSVQFCPALSERKLAAVDQLGMGVLNKVALRFPERFWPGEPDFIEQIPEIPGEYPEFLNLWKHTGAPVLIAFTGGDHARRLEARDDARVSSEVSRVLCRMFGRDTPRPLSVRVSRWASDPFARGSYSHIPVGATGEAYDVLAEPLAGGRLMFAGEATIRRYPGTVHGAYLSGVREAERMANMV